MRLFSLKQGSVRAANNPALFVDIVSPVSNNPGSTGVVLTVRGTGFVACSTVLWNGTALVTTFVSAEHQTAAVPDAFVAAVGLGSVIVTVPRLEVANPASLMFALRKMPRASRKTFGWSSQTSGSEALIFRKRVDSYWSYPTAVPGICDPILSRYGAGGR